MADLKISGIVVAVLAVAIWGLMYMRGGTSGMANVVLLLGGSVAATLLALDWADSYTS